MFFFFLVLLVFGNIRLSCANQNHGGVLGCLDRI